MTDAPDLPDVLRLERTGDHVWCPPFEARPEVSRDVVFGGQILAQMIMASAREHDFAKEVKSMHAIFSRPASFSQPLEYEVETVHDGRSFGSDTVTCRQDGRVMARGLLLLNVDEPDLVRHTAVTMPDVPGPDDPAGRPDGRVFPGAEGMICWGVDTWSDAEPLRDPVQNVWMRYAPGVESIPAAQAVLAWATDGYLIGTSLLPHEGFNEGHAHRTISTGPVSHTVNFHERVDVADWLLLATESVWAGRGRTYGRGNIFTRDGTLVANYSQDAIVRHFGDGRDHSADYGRVM